MSGSKIELLPKEMLVRTSAVDHADWNYRPILGLLQRVRFKLVASLLSGMTGSSCLEIGYGSGVFFPHLKKHFDRIAGIDIHNCNEEVRDMVREFGIDSDLSCGDVAKMDYPDNTFDCAVAVSSLEYVEAIDDACSEIIRVLKPDGTLVVVTPGQSPLLDFGLKVLGREDAESNYGDRRSQLIATLEKYFAVKQSRKWPGFLPGLTVYKALKLRPR